jgi:hypothetical protein
LRHCTKIFYVIFLITSLTHAQRSDIRGYVTDSTSGERIPFVSVMIAGTAKGTSTNAIGFYLLAGQEPGTYNLQFSIIGYRKKLLTVIVRQGKPTVLNVRLVPENVQMGEVIVEDERITSVSEMSASMHIVNPAELQKIPVAVQGDLLRAIQILPGIVSTSDVNAKFYVRGGAGDQNLILLDGMKIYNPFHAFGVFSIFDPDLISATEVYTGAFPAGFGNRLSSVINVTTRSGNTMNLSGRADVNSFYSKVQLEGPISNGLSGILHFRRSIFRDAFHNFLQNDLPLSFYDGFGKITFETGENVRYALQYFFSGDDVKGSTATDASYKWRSESYALSLTSLINERLFLQGIIYNNYFLTSREVSNNPLVSPATSQIKELGIKAFFTSFTESQSQYHFGFEFCVPEFTNRFRNNANLALDLSNAALDLSLWLRYEHTVDHFRYDIGVHVAPVLAVDYGFSLQVFQPRLNVSYALQENLFAKVSYGKFSQNVIALNNEEDVISLFEAWAGLPENLKPEMSDHYVLGIDYRFLPLSTVTAQVYYKTYSSLALYNRNKITSDQPDYLSGSGSAYGFELLLRHRIEWIEFIQTYTYGHTNVTVDGFTYAPRYDRRHTLNLAGTVSPLKSVEISLRWEFGSGLPFTQTTGFYDRLTIPDPVRIPYYNETGRPIATLGPKNAARLPYYHRLDCGVHYSYSFNHGTKVKFGVNIINLYNQKNIMYYDRYTAQTIYMLPFFPSATIRAEF